ncbi:hypothetical protein FACS189490_13240 [Clostridia bacterium]|nr:hypothetical protein FACS189490_13240 [Clostridia bacterium]
MSSRMGRPYSENPRNVDVKVRLTQEEATNLEKCADKLKTTKTGVIVKGINKLWSEINEKE